MASFLFDSSLPNFDTLLIKGPYPQLSPIALAINHLQRKDTDTEGTRPDVLLLTRSREAFATAVQECNDAWMNDKLAKGTFMSLMARVLIYYPPTPAHWHLLLSLLTPVNDSDEGTPDKIILRHPLSLIIVHEPSAYFSNSMQDAAGETDQPNKTLSDYLRIIVSSLACARHLSASEKQIPLVLFDSKLNEFKLPILSRPEIPARLLLQRGDDADERQKTVLRFVEKYFEWVGSIIEEDSKGKEESAYSQASTSKPHYFRFRVERRGSDEDIDIESPLPHVEQWSATSLKPQPFSLLNQTLLKLKIDQMTE